MILTDNFLDKEYFKSLQDTVFDNHFPWYLNPITEKDLDKPLVHIAYDNNKPNSDFYEKLIPCLNKLDVICVFRIKVNLLLKSHKRKTYGFHTDLSDCPIPYKIAILYMNTNNGMTIFKDNKKIKSVENRIIVFSGDLEHTGTTNTDKDIPIRCLINIVYW